MFKTLEERAKLINYIGETRTRTYLFINIIEYHKQWSGACPGIRKGGPKI